MKINFKLVLIEFPCNILQMHIEIENYLELPEANVLSNFGVPEMINDIQTNMYTFSVIFRLNNLDKI